MKVRSLSANKRAEWVYLLQFYSIEGVSAINLFLSIIQKAYLQLTLSAPVSLEGVAAINPPTHHLPPAFHERDFNESHHVIQKTDAEKYSSNYKAVFKKMCYVTRYGN